MKRLCVLLISAMIAFPATSQAEGFWKELGKAVKASLPKVSFPVVEQVAGRKIAIDGNGIDVLKYNLVVRNPLPAMGVVFGYGKKIAVLGPGGIAVDDRRAQVHQERVPIMAFYYDDLGNGQLGGFLGISTGQAYFTPGWIQSQPLTLERMMGPDGEVNMQSLLKGPARDDLSDHPVHLPRKWNSGTTGLQVGNASSYTVRLAVNGHVLAMIPPKGGFGYWEWEVIQAWGVVRSIQLDYLKSAGVGPDGKPPYLLVRSIYDLPLNLTSWGIEGRQLVIGPPQIGAWIY